MEADGEDDAKSEATSFDRQTMLRIKGDDEDDVERDLDLEARYAQSILANLSKNVTCRARMYQRHLKHASLALKKTIKSGATIKASDSISTANNIVDDRTLVDFFANAKDRDFISAKMAKRFNQIVAIHAEGPTPEPIDYGTTSYATYASGSGSPTLVFEYYVLASAGKPPSPSPSTTAWWARRRATRALHRTFRPLRREPSACSSRSPPRRSASSSPSSPTRSGGAPASEG